MLTIHLVQLHFSDFRRSESWWRISPVHQRIWGRTKPRNLIPSLHLVIDYLVNSSLTSQYCAISMICLSLYVYVMCGVGVSVYLTREICIKLPKQTGITEVWVFLVSVSAISLWSVVVVFISHVCLGCACSWSLMPCSCIYAANSYTYYISFSSPTLSFIPDLKSFFSANTPTAAFIFSSWGLTTWFPDFYCYFWPYIFILFSVSVLQFLVVVSVQ